MVKTICWSVALAAGSALGQTATMPPHALALTGSGFCRGYWFVAPADFRITGVRPLQAPTGTNGFMNCAVMRFTGNIPPPPFPAFTNAFTTLALVFDQPSGAFFPVSIDVHAGEVIGIYGNTAAAAVTTSATTSVTANAVQATTVIMGSTVNLTRTGTFITLTSVNTPQGMQDVWTDSSSLQVGRTEFTYTPLGGTCQANCDNSTSPPCLNVNDFACFLNAYSAGQAYANCDGSTAPPVLNVNDFACFLNRFAGGCGGNGCAPHP